ncbi:DJ-1/PfpI family protein [Candidatus Neomarinimicrobiota bacterium]
MLSKKIFQLSLLIFCSILSNLYADDDVKYIEQNKIDVLLIADDNYGSSFVVGDNQIKSIKQQFEEFGWNLIIAGVKDTLAPCDWGNQTYGTDKMIVTKKISEIKNLAKFAAIIILPGRGFPNLLNSAEMMSLLKRANQEGIIIAAWCRGVRLLAAADIIRGKNVIGHFDYFDDYKAAGANYIEYSFMWDNGKKIFQNVTPPIRDGNIITTVRSLYYRNEMCQLIKETIEENLTGD